MWYAGFRRGFEPPPKKFTKRNRMKRKKPTKKKDVNQLANAMMEAIANGELPKTTDGKDPLAVALGRRGGLKGGPARMAMLTAEERSELGRKAIQTRWAKAANNDGHTREV
jgi:hypothetical protein